MGSKAGNETDHIYYIDRRGRRYKRISHEQRVELRKSYVANIPFWRRPLIGCIVSVLLIGACAYSLHYLLTISKLTLFSPTSATSILLVPLILIALLWGVGPALLAILVGTAAIAYWLVPSISLFDIQSWPNAIQFLPFVITGLIVALITAQRERARLNALMADWELQAYARHLEEVNQKLADASQMKDHFMSIASHELKTPITTIRGQAQLLLRRIARHQQELSPDMQDIHHTLSRINEQTGRLTTLIEELLEMSSIRNGRIDLQKKMHDLRKICQEVVSDEQMLSGRSITLTMPPEEVNVSVDGDRLSQVVTNLVSNAVKYSPESNPIDVNLYQENGSTWLCVRDYGKGITPEQQKRIFEPFYRSPDAKSSSKRGMGLGLAISKEIVVRHGGRIWCESTPGKGSSFMVELPSQ